MSGRQCLPFRWHSFLDWVFSSISNFYWTLHQPLLSSLKWLGMDANGIIVLFAPDLRATYIRAYKIVFYYCLDLRCPFALLVDWVEPSIWSLASRSVISIFWLRLADPFNRHRTSKFEESFISGGFFCAVDSTNRSRIDPPDVSNCRSHRTDCLSRTWPGSS